jgi:hypothetical protein
VTKREWQIEMANRFAKRDNVKELEAKLECYERLADASEMASNPMGVKSREALKNVREMKTIVTKDEEIRKAVEAEREACANICETLELPDWPDKVRQPLAQAIRARGQA